MSSDLCLGGPPNPLDENETHVSKLLGSSPIKVSGSRAKLNKSRTKAVLALGSLRIEIGLIPSHRYVKKFWTFRGFSWLFMCFFNICHASLLRTKKTSPRSSPVKAFPALQRRQNLWALSAQRGCRWRLPSRPGSIILCEYSSTIEASKTLHKFERLNII